MKALVYDKSGGLSQLSPSYCHEVGIGCIYPLQLTQLGVEAVAMAKVAVLGLRPVHPSRSLDTFLHRPKYWYKVARK